MSENQQNSLKRGRWLYLGGEDGYNLVHMVVDIDTETDPKMPHVMTWSIPDQDNQDEGGWTWSGPLNLFVKSFKALGPVDQTET